MSPRGLFSVKSPQGGIFFLILLIMVCHWGESSHELKAGTWRYHVGKLLTGLLLLAHIRPAFLFNPEPFPPRMAFPLVDWTSHANQQSRRSLIRHGHRTLVILQLRPHDLSDDPGSCQFDNRNIPGRYKKAPKIHKSENIRQMQNKGQSSKWVILTGDASQWWSL